MIEIHKHHLIVLFQDTQVDLHCELLESPRPSPGNPFRSVLSVDNVAPTTSNELITRPKIKTNLFRASPITRQTMRSDINEDGEVGKIIEN